MIDYLGKPKTDADRERMLAAAWARAEDRIKRAVQVLTNAQPSASSDADPGTAFHARVLDLICDLIQLDPDPDSPNGRLLGGLADAAERFEKERWPIMAVCRSGQCLSAPIAGSSFCAEHQP